jgi:hypothetical protein
LHVLGAGHTGIARVAAVWGINAVQPEAGALRRGAISNADGVLLAVLLLRRVVSAFFGQAQAACQDSVQLLPCLSAP